MEDLLNDNQNYNANGTLKDENNVNSNQDLSNYKDFQSS
jgi:hypothetical protein